MRRYMEKIEVKTVVRADALVPDQFIWNGRLYVVRDILRAWSEARPWWRQAPPLRNRALAAPIASDYSGSAKGGVITTTVAQPVVQTDAELRVWRVEAASGARGRIVVVDVGRDPESGEWQLMRVLD